MWYSVRNIRDPGAALTAPGLANTYTEVLTVSDHSRLTNCRFCSAPIQQRSGPGRPRLYCSNMCRARQYMSTHFAVDVDAIITKWGSDCYLCGDPVDPDAPFGPKMLNVDHIVPLSRDGGDYIQNMRVVHYACNTQAIVVQEFRHQALVELVNPPAPYTKGERLVLDNERLVMV